MSVVVGELSAEKGSHLTLTWKILDFFDQLDVDFKSREFQFADASWYLEMLPVLNDRFLGIFLSRSPSYVPEHSVSVTLELMTSLGDKHKLSDIKYYFDDEETWARVGKIKLSMLEERRDLFVPEGKLTLYCHMRLTASDSLDVPQTEAVETPSIAPQLSRDEELRKRLPSIEKLQSDYKKLLKSGVGSDVCLVVSGKEFRAHESILKSRSPVFCAMFENEMQEKASGKVIIDDLDPDLFPNFLEYVYAGCVKDLSDENVCGMYAAAEKYDLQTLKSECLEFMRRCLSVDCFCDVMTLSLRYKEEEMMDLAIEFFKHNLAKIIVTVKWQVFMKENSTAANELFIKALVPAEDKP